VLLDGILDFDFSAKIKEVEVLPDVLPEHLEGVHNEQPELVAGVLKRTYVDDIVIQRDFGQVLIGVVWPLNYNLFAF